VLSLRKRGWGDRACGCAKAFQHLVSMRRAASMCTHVRACSPRPSLALMVVVCMRCDTCSLGLFPLKSHAAPQQGFGSPVSLSSTTEAGICSDLPKPATITTMQVALRQTQKRANTLGPESSPIRWNAAKPTHHTGAIEVKVPLHNAICQCTKPEGCTDHDSDAAILWRRQRMHQTPLCHPLPRFL
jgi:hypothetical protein